MDVLLLATKVQIPPQRRAVIARPRLSERLESSVSHNKLILVAAPAGYGKSTLLAQWAHSSHHRPAWLSIDEKDNDREQFLRYLLAAWDEVQPGVMESPLGTLLGATSPDRDAVLTAFINVADDVSKHTVFVLDDYHLIKDAAIHEALTFLLDHLPPMMHFVLAGRGEPPLPLARYRARGEMVEVRTDDLRFLPTETANFLNEMMELDLPDDSVGKLHAQLEGWIAGLQLVVLTQQQRLPADNLIVAGRQRFIADYLREEVLDPLPDTVRRFLLQTSILDRLSGPLCDEVTGRVDGQEMLETLERENLFLMPLDNRREWFRYHRLFADYLREELMRRHPEEVAALHRRAARWHLVSNLAEPAYYHAVNGEDVDLVIRIFERYSQAMLIGSEFKRLHEWLDALPPAWHAEYPLIGLVGAGLLLFTGRLDACIRSVEAVERRLVTAGDHNLRRQLAQVNAVRCSIACFQNDLRQAEQFATHAFHDLPDDDRFFRAIILGSLGDTYRRNGRWREAKECYGDMLDFIHEPAFRVQSAHVYGALADLELRQGRLRAAAGYWREALAAIEERETWGRLPLPLTGWVYIRMGELLYEWNDLTEAWEHLSRGLERAELGGDVRAMIAGYLIAGRLKLTEGNVETAIEYLQKTRPLVERAQFSHWVDRFERFQLELWLAQDQLRTAVHWADEIGQDEAREERPESAVGQLALARVLVVKGDEPSLRRALMLLNRLLQTAQEAGRKGIVIEGLALEAMAHGRGGDSARAMTSLERSLRLAEPNGYVRRFADLGLPMARLLQEARARAVMPDYVATLLAAFGSHNTLPTAVAQLPEPLTDRERDVLGLMAAGLTNHEIAEELVISAGTVKRHASNIYGKLRVGGRTEAAARARELDLLS